MAWGAAHAGKATNPGARFFDRKRVAVVGIGKSGLAVLNVLADLSTAELSAWDGNSEALASIDLSRGGAGILAESIPDPEDLAHAVMQWHPDIIVPAPAISELSPLFREAERAGIPLWGEIELAWQLRAVAEDGTSAPWLCVTGTNGKTTTVSMTAAILGAAGLGDLPIGNIGNPALLETSRTDAERPGAFALELSSFQLRTIHTMSPVASVCLNIDDDHLEWHGDFAAYRAAKARVYERVMDACVYPVGDTAIQEMVDNADVIEGARAIGVVPGVPQIGQIGIVEGIVVDRAFGSGRHRGEAIELFEVADIAHLAPGGGELPLHIVKDALAATALARAAGIEPAVIREAMRAFQPGEHRIEHVATKGGVRFVDDSKATNAHAARASVSAHEDDSVVWIVGGLAKGARFESLVADLAPKLHAVVVIGTDQAVWHDALAPLTVPITWIPTDSERPMDEAVTAAVSYARPGDTVLLAPATASFDQFGSYADRGEKFRHAVEALEG